MSAYQEYETEFKDTECLLKALEMLGWKREQVEIHETPVGLYGYHGDLRKDTAEMVIRRKNLVQSSNDLGFRKEGGLWKMVVSDYDRTAILSRVPKHAVGTDFPTVLKQAYGVARIESNAKRRYQVEKKDVTWGEPVRMKVTIN